MENRQHGLRSTDCRRRPVRFLVIASFAFVCVAAGLAILSAPAHPGEQRTAGTTITGVIRDQDGEPISRAFVQLDRESTTSVPFQWTDADAQGRFELKNVPAGAVRIRAVAGHSRLFSSTDKVVESKGGARDLVITLEAGREVRVKIEDFDRYDHSGVGSGVGSVPAARLVWDQPRTESRDFRWAPIAKDGSVRFVQLPDKPSFEVWGRASLDRPFKKSGLKPSKNVTVIRTVRGLRISGKILPAKVAVEDDPRVDALPYPGLRVGYGRIESDGTFVIRGLIEGEYEVFCALRNKRKMGMFAYKTVRAGATDVELDFREGGDR